MGKNLITGLAILILSSGVSSSAQNGGAAPGYSVIDLMVSGSDLPIATTAYAPDVKSEIERHIQRWQAYRSPRARPTGSSELEMVYSAHVRYERLLVAVSDDPRGPALAGQYVNKLQPCYEWEGFHDCPEAEAVFAENYQAANPAGPFREYLPLLAAHRWLCAAEAYEYEKRPQDGDRSRVAYRRAMATARQSTNALVRKAVEELTTRARCFVQR